MNFKGCIDDYYNKCDTDEERTDMLNAAKAYKEEKEKLDSLADMLAKSMQTEACGNTWEDDWQKSIAKYRELGGK